MRPAVLVHVVFYCNADIDRSVKTSIFITVSTYRHASAGLHVIIIFCYSLAT